MTQVRLGLPVIAFFVWAACIILCSAIGKLTAVRAHISGRHTRADNVSHSLKPGAECTFPRSPDHVEIQRIYQVQRAKLDRHLDELMERGDISKWKADPGSRVWDLFPPIYDCPSKEKLGIQTGDGGKYVCGVNTFLQRSTCTALSFGSDGETSFEEDILNRTPCEVHTFDPTLDSKKRALVENVSAIHLHEYGLGAEDGRAKMADSDVVINVKTLPTILDELQIHWVDTMKVHIEGAEWKVLGSMLDHYNGQLPFTQLQIELHLCDDRTNALEAVGVLRRLESAGLRAFSTEYNCWGPTNGCNEYAFLNVNECGVVEG